jgi:hypothetical protein
MVGNTVDVGWPTIKSGCLPTTGPPVSTTLAKLVAKFAAGVVDTRVVDTGGAPFLANISANFRKNSKRS